MNPSNISLGELAEELHILLEKVCIAITKGEVSSLSNKGQFLAPILRMKPNTAANQFYQGKFNFDTLSENSFIGLKEYFHVTLKNKVSNDTVYQNLLSQFSKLEPKLQEKFETPLADIHGKYSQILKNVYSRIPSAFNDSKWWLYERHADTGAEIGRKVVIFKKTSDEKVLSVTMLPFMKNSHEWIGEAKFLRADQFLLVNLFNTEGQNDYVHFTIKIDNRTSQLQLCIGHMTLKHTAQNNVVTRMIVLEKTTDDTKNIIQRRFSLNDKIIPEPIRQFLADRRLNRLPSPHVKEIYDLPTLEQWLKQNTDTVNKMYAKLAGTFTLYYKQNVDDKSLTEDQKLTKDNLTLTPLTNNQMQVIYQHGIDVTDTSTCWKGEGYVNSASHTFYASLKGSFESPDDDTSLSHGETKPTFLLIDVPSQEQNKIDILVGIATAPRDEDKGSVARLILLVRKSDEYDSEMALKALEFFDVFRNKMRVRPPSDKKVYNLRTLNASIEHQRKRNDKN